MSKAHPGFKSVQGSIAKKEHVSSEAAGRILGAATRRASASAKAANPRLKRVKGKMHEGGTIKSTGLYEMEKGEKVIPAKGHAYEHLKVEAFPNHVESNGPGHYEIDGNDIKFVRG